MEGHAQAIAPLYGEREGMASGLAGPSHSYLRDETRVAKTLNQSFSASDVFCSAASWRTAQVWMISGAPRH